MFGFLFDWVQVQWDEPSSVPRPDRVSSWEIEPVDDSTLSAPSSTLLVQKNKRPLSPIDLSLLGKASFLLVFSFGIKELFLSVYLLFPFIVMT